MRWVQLCGSLSILWHCLSLGLEWKLTFCSPVATAVFQICWHIECSTFTAASFRIWNSSTGIPSPSLAMCVVMLPKVHLSSDSRMSGSRWATTPSWLSGSLRFFVWFFCAFCVFCIVLLCILKSLQLLLGPYCFCPLSCPSFFHNTREDSTHGHH